MDPTANLRAQLEIARRIAAAIRDDAPIDPSEASRLAELVLALDGWILAGGFLPETWVKGGIPFRDR